ncbi:MAG TPA: T9SS type A sorting domain-containing protein, partial [Saprospiraceae bacterium]|nr:T9SS type A sorting domain-containing protein [Saprospiraceae bacterium]
SSPLTITTAANTFDPGTGQLPQIASLNLFPNPASDAVQVRFSGSLMPDAELWLTDVTGRVLSRQRMLLDQQQLDVSALPSGVYFVSLRQDGQAMQVERLMKP